MNKAAFFQLLRLFIKFFLFIVAFYTISDEAGLFDFIGIKYEANAKYRLAVMIALAVTFFRQRELSRRNKNSAKPA